ncbi:hypothetical protein BC828DRAFT_115581 [Blastocladiella britannica]|nr:hypothetical protein BC828DRAFT_115581 [Blastocladiella britannica]
MAETLPLVPFSTQVGTMVRLRLRLYARNPKLVLVGLASPLISIGMAIGLSALFSSMLPKMTLGDSIDGLPLLPLQAAGFDDVHPGTGPLLAGGGADPASVAIMQSVVSSFFTQSRGASAKSVVWQSPADMNAFIAQEQRRIDAPKSIDPQDWAPTSGFLVHAPGAGSPTSPFVDPSAVNLSLIVNGEAPSTSRSLGRAPLIMTNLVHNALQPILTFTPLDALNGGAGQDPRTRPTGSNAPTGAAARASIDALIAKYRTALAASRANGGSNPPTAPWAMFLKGSMSSFPIQASDIFDLSAQIVPPFVSFGLTMLMLLFTEELVRERADGIFDYLVLSLSIFLALHTYSPLI